MNLFVIAFKFFDREYSYIKIKNVKELLQLLSDSASDGNFEEIRPFLPWNMLDEIALR